MLVIVILGGLVALVGPKAWDGTSHDDQKVAMIQLRNFAAAIDNYKMVNRKLPDSLQTLTQGSDSNPEPFLEHVPNDPWGRGYEYRVEGKRSTVRSHGADGRPDTPDDIVWPEK